MQTSQQNYPTSGVHGFYSQYAPDVTPYCSSHYQVFDKNMYPDNSSQGNEFSFQTYDEEAYFTLDSTPNTGLYKFYDSPCTVSTSSNRSPFSPQGSQSYISDPHQSFDNYGSPLSGSSVVDDNTQVRNILRDLERSLMGPDSPQMSDGHYCSLNHQGNSNGGSSKQLMEMLPRMEIKDILCLCARAVAENDLTTSETLMNALDKMVSVCGTPMQRLAAYMLEGLRAKLESSGYTIYRKLRCEQPTSSELLSYMHILYEVCPYYKFAYVSSNLIIQEAIGNDRSIHIIDFQIGMGTQWRLLFKSLAHWPGGPPLVRITGVDDSQSAYARGGGLELVEKILLSEAKSCGVPFEFHGAAMSGCQVERENLNIRPGEALAVNFPYMLHHMPDESVSTTNHRDRLLRLVKSLSPRVVTVVEQESNTNTLPFLKRFSETLDYYTAMFESVDVALARDDKKRINAEMHCLARDIVNMIACEDVERVERHELFGKWYARLDMAGFTQLPLSYSVNECIRDMMKQFDKNYRLEYWKGALFLGWKNRVMASSSAWR